MIIANDAATAVSSVVLSRPATAGVSSPKKGGGTFFTRARPPSTCSSSRVNFAIHRYQAVLSSFA